MLIRKTVVPAALLLALSAGCANNTAPIDAGGAPEPAPVTSSAAAPSAPAGSTTLTGTVTAGVEPNCLLLKDGTGDHLLVFGDQKTQATVQVGAEVTVVGKADPGMMTTCMQGEPFLVSSVAGS
ncbi:hypothetical protein GCM10010112_68910 [Actinoplanes lobatus]|uniref:Lipoprotein n=1 Tax=Actinoplanes lobatus TaxID=113568 RepID=A0A7W7MG78_9ACTN|nr:hypothetical protein [Actinoplanes lobatus]MBB4749028.1 hypothetical protein [Actinoplanes lobatus]GGN86877.1 hypothetical protein GCM10010112_68910 [Actinoplanes lobatus]GIE42873.1 hypothetical protein Alo02nite_57710 [Actinoplanes lobatus]